MPEKEKPHFEVVGGTSTPEGGEVQDAIAFEELVYAHMCGVDMKPEWCVFGGDGGGGQRIHYYIRPSDDAEFVARRIARYMNAHGAHVAVQMTEWNRELRGDDGHSGVLEESHSA